MNKESSQHIADDGEGGRAYFESNAVCTNPLSPVGLSTTGSDKLLEATSTELAISLDGPAVG